MTEKEGKQVWDAAWEAAWNEAMKQSQEQYNELVDQYNSLLDDYNQLLEKTQNNNETEDFNPEEIKKYLKSIVEIKQPTFDSFAIKLTNFAFSQIEDDGWFEFNYELEGQLEESVYIKLNFYDEDNNLLYTDKDFICNDDFSGFDTSTIALHEKNLAFNTKKILVYVTK
ncbi:hypothetical protein [Treponema sp. C6A8]|uniref:hypothetical protein n=1 Tax=Treponema sp. C6A8 TaxID=1410609 RepID=UPI0004866FEA|nr:hypothetical protein [Treponema sp. C6A8]